MKVREILEMNEEDLRIKMTDEEFERMQNLGISNSEELLDLLKESARLSGQELDEEHILISAYLDYLEEMKNKNTII